MASHCTSSTDLEQSARDADLICSATASSEPLLRGEWLTPGVHVDLVGAFTETMREADNDVFRRGRVHVDSRSSTVAETGELIIPIRDGVLGEADILADLYELCQGLRAGRTDPEAITVFKNGGGGHLDLMTARLVYDRVVWTRSRLGSSRGRANARTRRQAATAGAVMASTDAVKRLACSADSGSSGGRTRCHWDFPVTRASQHFRALTVGNCSNAPRYALNAA